MGYSRSLSAINRHFAIFKQVLTEPETSHDFELVDWAAANRLAYQLREGMYAAQFNTGYEHIARLKETHKLKVENNMIRVMPKYNPEMIRRIQPIPLWAKYGSRKSTITCEEAKDVIEVASTMRDLNSESPWNDVVFSSFRFDKLTSQQRKVLYEMAQAIGYELLDLEEGGFSLVRPTPDSTFSAIYYTPDDEGSYSVKLDTE